MPAKPPWLGGTKVTTASSVRPRSWARQGKPPTTEPERQPRPERIGVLTSASAAVVVAAPRSSAVAQARRVARVRPTGRAAGLAGAILIPTSSALTHTEDSRGPGQA